MRCKLQEMQEKERRPVLSQLESVLMLLQCQVGLPQADQPSAPDTPKLGNGSQGALHRCKPHPSYCRPRNCCDAHLSSEAMELHTSDVVKRAYVNACNACVYPASCSKSRYLRWFLRSRDRTHSDCILSTFNKAMCQHVHSACLQQIFGTLVEGDRLDGAL